MKLPGKLSAGIAAIALTTIGAFEGYRTHAYRDPVGIPTICFGETKNVHMGDVKTKKECEDLLTSRLEQGKREIDKCLKVSVPDKTYASFLSFEYNVGAGAFCKSTLVRKANAGDLIGACKELPKWNKAGGHVLKGLTKRRAAEMEMCLAEIKAR